MIDNLKCAIVLLTPAYKTQEITSPVTVLMQLRKPSDNSCGEPMPFQYFPCIKGISMRYIRIFIMNLIMMKLMVEK